MCVPPFAQLLPLPFSHTSVCVCVHEYKRKKGERERGFRLHTVALFAAAAFGCEFNEKNEKNPNEREEEEAAAEKVEHHDYCKETLLPSDIACRRRRIAAAAVPHIFPLSFMCSVQRVYVYIKSTERRGEGSW
jgi:hypothetical protein